MSSLEHSSPDNPVEVAIRDPRIHPARCITCHPRQLGPDGGLAPAVEFTPADDWADPRRPVDGLSGVVWTHVPCGHAAGMRGSRVLARAAELGPPRPAQAGSYTHAQATADVDQHRDLHGRYLTLSATGDTRWPMVERSLAELRARVEARGGGALADALRVEAEHAERVYRGLRCGAGGALAAALDRELVDLVAARTRVAGEAGRLQE